jgi:hypothetical protein
MSDWQGRDAVPDGEREFPDLEPIRGRKLSDSDNRGLPGGGPSGGRGRHSAGRDSSGEQAAPPWADQAQPGGQQAPYSQQASYEQRGQYGGRQYEDQRGPDQYGQDQYGQPGQQSYGGGRSSQQAGEQYADEQYRGQQQPAGRQEQSRQERPRQPQQRSRRRGPAVAPGRPSASSWDDNDEVTDDPMEAPIPRRKTRAAAGGCGSLAAAPSRRSSSPSVPSCT